MSNLFTSIRLRDLEIRNRIFVSPMCQYSAIDGVATPWHLVHLGSRAVGGAGMVIVEATGVVPAGRITPSCLGLWNDMQRDALQPIAQFIKDQGAVPAIQLAHAGRKGSTNAPWISGGGPLTPEQGAWPTYAPSALAFAPLFPTPRAMSKADIEATVTAFADGARRAAAAGFEAVELHMAHGYLLHQFLSPLTNQRDDEYGGNLENRMRLPLAVTAAVRVVWPDKNPLMVRISATDWMAGGWDIGQTIELCKRLKTLGVDFIDCSTGGLVPNANIPVAPGFQIPFASVVREQVEIATGAVGLITRASQANEIVEQNQAHVVLLAREMLRDPYWPMHAAQQLGIDIQWPMQYLRAKA